MKCLDTNILIYAADLSSPFHRRAVDFISQTARGEWPSCVCYQSLCEFTEIITGNRVRSPQSLDVAEKFMDRLLKYPQPAILYPDETILRQSLRLMQRYPSLNKRFRDARIAATLMKHGVKILVTANSAPFLAIRELEIENPFEALFA
jgi:predicted nucleic acid-binding protein